MIEQKQEHALNKKKSSENLEILTGDTEEPDMEPTIELIEDLEMLEEENTSLKNSELQHIIANIAQTDPATKSKVMDFIQSEFEELEDERITQFADKIKAEETVSSKNEQEFTSELVRNTISKSQYAQAQIRMKSIITKSKFKYADKNTQILSNFLRYATGLTYKQISIDKNLKVILMFPLIISRYSRSLIVEKTGIRANSYTGMEKHPVIEDLKNNLESVFEKLPKNLRMEGNILRFLQEQFQTKICVKKSVLKKPLYFQSGKAQVKIFVNPIVVNTGEVGFLDASLRFAYYPDYNAHVVKIDDLNDLLFYLESKYVQIESYRKNKTAKKIYTKALNRYATHLQLSSIPFLGCGAILFVLILLFPLLSIPLASLSIGILCLYAFLHGLLFYRFYAENKALQQSFQKLYHNSLKEDRGLLIRCRPFFSEEEIDQLTFEINSSGNKAQPREATASYNTILSQNTSSVNPPSETSSQTIRNKVEQPHNGGNKDLESTNEIEIQHTNSPKEQSISDSIHKKFQSFLED